MEQNYTATISVSARPAEVFKSINDIAKWWTDELEGNSQKLNDEFTVHFADLHHTTQKLIEFIPDQKVVWLVTESRLTFIKDQSEWKNTKIVFDIIPHGDQTQIRFAHIGLVPAIECFNICTKGWDYYFKGSLFKLLTEGKGTPGM